MYITFTPPKRVLGYSQIKEQPMSLENIPNHAEIAIKPPAHTLKNIFIYTLSGLNTKKIP